MSSSDPGFLIFVALKENDAVVDAVMKLVTFKLPFVWGHEVSTVAELLQVVVDELYVPGYAELNQVDGNIIKIEVELGIVRGDGLMVKMYSPDVETTVDVRDTVHEIDRAEAVTEATVRSMSDAVLSRSEMITF